MNLDVFNDSLLVGFSTNRVLAQSKPTATVLTTIFTATTRTYLNRLFVANISNSVSSFRVAVRPLGVAIADTHYIYYDIPIAGRDTFLVDLDLGLEDTDEISVYSDSNSLVFNIFGIEQI
jgi:hypothetical protein